MKVRDAKASDFDSIFMMGFDVWSDSASAEEYLKGCYESEKYNKGKFKVLEGGDRLLSSLIIYQLTHGWFGIGSIATPVELRNQGWGTKLTLDVAEQLEAEMDTIELYTNLKSDLFL